MTQVQPERAPGQNPPVDALSEPFTPGAPSNAPELADYPETLAGPVPPPRQDPKTAAFVEQWRNAAYNCFSSGHKFCREVCPVMQVDAQREPHARRRSTPTSWRWSRACSSRGRRRRLRQLHAVRRLRAALPEHAVHRRLLPLPHPHGRRRQGRCARCRRERHPPARLAALERADRRATTTSRCWARRRVCQEHVADWADGLDIPIGGETILFVDCEAAFYRTVRTRGRSRSCCRRAASSSA